MICFHHCLFMKRDGNYFLKNYFLSGPYPKSIRNKSLRKLLIIDASFSFYSEDSGMKKSMLIDNQKKCIEYIMKTLKVNQRTAYDYYNTLLYINYLPKYAHQAIAEQLDRMARYSREKK